MKKERKKTPIGEAKWAHIRKPKDAFDNTGSPKYQIDVVFDPKDKEWKEWATDLRERVEAAKLSNVPIKPEKNQDGEATGRFFATFKTGEQYPPKVFDADGRDDTAADYLIGNGSTVRIGYTESEYTGFGGGITLYLSAIQIIELNEYSGSSAKDFGFDVSDKGVLDDIDDGLNKAPAGIDDGPGSDLPF